MAKHPVIVSCIGWSGTGKTGFIEACIRECSHRGLRVSALKKSRHEPNLPEDTKDSTRFFKAGAQLSAYMCDESLVRISKSPGFVTHDSLTELFPSVDCIFCEGLEVDAAYKVLVAGNDHGLFELKRPLDTVDCLVSASTSLLDHARNLGMKAYHPDDVGLFIDALHIKENRMEKLPHTVPERTEIKIYCDGKELPLGPFTADICRNTILALVGSLKGAESARSVNITISSTNL
jgi:molybdopterin-guanine dinucleotide biosynthesis protein MobB